MVRVRVSVLGLHHGFVEPREFVGAYSLKLGVYLSISCELLAAASEFCFWDFFNCSLKDVT